MGKNFSFFTMILAVIVAILGHTFFGLAEEIVLRFTGMFLSENISQWMAISVGITCSIVGYKNAFKQQLEKVCRENFLAYRINLNIFLSKLDY